MVKILTETRSVLFSLPSSCYWLQNVSDKHESRASMFGLL